MTNQNHHSIDFVEHVQIADWTVELQILHYLLDPQQMVEQVCLETNHQPKRIFKNQKN